ncbi:KTSC domain-containing protein [Sphingobium yanoikuyae]|mgnify:FL=1|uniref:KTSC domain-containing protein n=1 Tax=Sphingobium yanoikuyae TaxID=13690 RepID=UPI00242C5F21|nr:KTSC domain-containing protein [Sphingobium yanoikuyae]
MRAHRFNPSSTIDRIRFDDDAGILRVSFRETGIYFYYDVPAAIFEAFCEAPSAGAFFNERIRDQFRCRRDLDRRRFGPNA